MKDYINISGQQIELTQEQIQKLVDALGIQIQKKTLAEFKPGDTVKIGSHEMVVLEQFGQETALILKNLWVEESEFGAENNQYDGSIVDSHCETFAQALSAVIGWDNIVPHEVDLTSDDGLKDYCTVERRASLITADMYRKYVDILDTVNPKQYWWLATPHSTKRHENDSWVKCVAPSGGIHYDFCNFVYGVRPFCILKSNIFVSD